MSSASSDKAVALKYQSIDELPEIVAVGAGEIAKRIVQLALDNNVPIHEDMELAEILGKLPVGSTISEESYKLVATVITFLYQMDKEFKNKHTFLKQIPSLNENTEQSLVIANSKVKAS